MSSWPPSYGSTGVTRASSTGGGVGVIGDPLQNLPHDLGLAASQCLPCGSVQLDELDANLQHCVVGVGLGGLAGLRPGGGTVA
jgi:hypothetical protein